MQHIRQAFNIDRSSVTLKAMPGITKCHLQPNAFEKMRVGLAFQLFGEKVLQGLQLYKTEIEAKTGSIKATQEFFRKINSLITAMTSRYPARALRPDSSSSATIVDFLKYLTAWEQHAGGAGGFVSESTAVGLRVTLSSTLELLSYLNKLGYKYLMTSRLSQDPLENLFSIVRQSSGCNDNPTPTQFLITMNCMSFYSLVKTVQYGNSDPCALSALLEIEGSSSAHPSKSTVWDRVDNLIDAGNLPAAEAALSAPGDHDQHVERSDSRLIYYVAGYAARKCIMKTNCGPCMQSVTLSSAAESSHIAMYTRQKDNGGLLYPSSTLFLFVEMLENLFTECFSRQELHADSIIDILSLVRARCRSSIGCSEHAAELTRKVISFYLTTRLHFFVKGINSEQRSRREAAKHRKISKTV